MKGVLPILYRDEYMVAVDKPSGLLVHRTAISSDSVVALQLLRDQLGCTVYPPHRLDRPTSGVLLFALDSKTASALAEAFRERRVLKTYNAVVRGHLLDMGVINYPLRETREQPESQPAVTRYRTLGHVEIPVPIDPHPTARYSLLELYPKTGRMHQIRKHLKHISHPIIGDTRYGDGRHNRFFREYFGVDRLLLFARVLELDHPVTGTPLRIEAPYPPSIQKLFTLLGWR